MSLDTFYVAGTGMSTFQNMMLTITNNVSNAQTTAYKKSEVEVESLFPKFLETAMEEFDSAYGVGDSDKKKRKLEFGTGVRIVDVRKDFSAGTIEVTNKPLDLAIQGNGFLQFRMIDGSLAYSRDGSLRQDKEGNVVNLNGYPLEPAIKIPDGSTAISIDSVGRVFAQANNEISQREVGQIMLARFPNTEGLQSIGQNLYVETQSTGEPIQDVPGQNSLGSIAQYSLEFSNVNIIDEMMKMVIVQRAFELVTKAVSSGESMLRNVTDIARAG